MHLIGQHICVISSNAFANYPDHFFTFINQSYFNFNHSCIPNLVRYGRGNTAICITMRAVKKGEQLFTFYLGYEVRDRQSKSKFLVENYGFQYKCEKCEPNYYMSVRFPSDPEWRYAFIEFKQNEQAIISNQNKELTFEVKRFD